MKLILIYGPPAVGKFTVARALQLLTDYKLLHNHQVSDLVTSVVERGTLEAADLNHQIRLAVYKAAAVQKLPGIISTLLYRHNIKDQVHGAIRDYIAIKGVEVFAVYLSCTIEMLEKRVGSSTRRGTNKIASVEHLRKVLAEEDLMRKLPNSVIKSLHIDTTHLAPYESANIIKNHIS